MQPLATGYTPEWTLGAWVAGQNAAMQEANNQEEQIKNYLANQRERQMQPLDVDVRAQEADLARAKMADPDYKKWLIEMTKGQGKSMGAAGDLAQAMSPWNIKNSIQGAQTQNIQGDLMQKLWQLKQNAYNGSGGPIGFNMQQQPSQGTQQGFNWQISPEVQAQRDADALQLVEQEMKTNPNDPALQRYAERLKTKSQVSGPAQTLQTDNPQYEQLMKMLMDTPEFRQKLMQQDERLNSNEYLKALTLQNALDRAKITAGAEKPAKTGQEALVRQLNKRLANQEITQDQYMLELAGIFNRATEKTPPSGPTIEVTPEGNLGNFKDKNQQQKYVPGTTKADPLGIR